jgi:hypothetical protein
MNLTEWRNQTTTEITLPSGLHVKAKTNVNLLDLALGGDIPNDLMAEVSRWIAPDGKLDVELDQFAKMAPVLNGLVKAVFIDPPAADEPDETHIGVNELPATDRVWLLRWANEGTGAGELRPFPE